LKRKKQKIHTFGGNTMRTAWILYQVNSSCMKKTKERFFFQNKKSEKLKKATFGPHKEKNEKNR